VEERSPSEATVRCSPESSGTYIYSYSFGGVDAMDLNDLLLVGAILSPWVALTFLIIGLRRRLANLRAELVRWIASFLFVDKKVDGKVQTSKDGKVIKTPNPELLAMAASYVDAALPIVAPRLLDWGKKNVKLGDVSEIAGGGALDEKALRPLVGKKYAGLAAVFLPGILSRLGFGQPHGPPAIETTARNVGSAPPPGFRPGSPG